VAQACRWRLGQGSSPLQPGEQAQGAGQAVRAPGAKASQALRMDAQEGQDKRKKDKGIKEMQ